MNTIRSTVKEMIPMKKAEQIRRLKEHTYGCQWRTMWERVRKTEIYTFKPLHLKWIVRKHLTRGFLCAVLDLSGTLWPLLIPEYSGIKRRGTPFPGLRNPGISHYVVISTLFLFMSQTVKGDCLQLSPSLIGIVLCF